MNARKAERLGRLAAALAERRSFHIRDAAELLGVSEMTIRRDIADNADQFSYFGGHIVATRDPDGDSPYHLSSAADAHALAKREACAHAVGRIHADDTVFIDCGTTLVHMVDLIPDDCRITAVCYALNVAEKLAKKPNVNMILLGGLYHRASASFSGSSGLDALNTLGINVAFLSAAGVDAERGATCAHFHEAEIKQRTIALSQRKYLICDSSKIGKRKAAFFGAVSQFDEIITEPGATALAE